MPPQVQAGERSHLRLSNGFSFALLAALLIAPSWAVHELSHRLGLHVGVSFGLAAAVTGLTFIAYAIDKRRAATGGWRTPESTLHLLELAGGWPGAFVAQRLLRHKCSKAAYQFAFWCIVAVHQYAAADYLLGWRVARGISDLVSRALS